MPGISDMVRTDPLVSYEEFEKMYPYIASLKSLFPPEWFPNTGAYEGVSGYTSGRRTDPKGSRRAVGLNMGLTAPEEAETRRHEYSHAGFDVSPNWSYIADMQEPTKELNYSLGLSYPKRIRVEEMMNRAIRPFTRDDYSLVRDIAKMLTPTQRQLLPYLGSYFKYGPAWGSMSGEEKSGYIVDPTHRGVQVENPDGTFSSEITMGTEIGGVHYLIPTLYRGNRLSPEEAVGMFRLGMLPAVGMASTKEELDEMAKARSKMLGEEGRKRTIQKGQVHYEDEEIPERSLYAPRWSEVA